jgi:hypothetical protein
MLVLLQAGNMTPIILWSVLGTASLYLGVQGFRPSGIPWSGARRLTGTSAKVAGVLCILFGLLCFAFLALIIVARSVRS